MARVMLALKTTLSAQDQVPLLIFDEVDANVGGEVGTRVGETLRALGAGHQVLCITHLPQVAALGAAHFEVSKTARDGRTVTQLRELDRPARIAELARMLGGDTPEARRLAGSLLKA
jgi:DNA repair protein RecN (Recombination protein N)